MNSDGAKKKHFSKKRIVISIICIIAVLAAGMLVYAASQLKYENIYKGISIGNINVGEMTKAEAENAVNKYAKQYNDLKLSFKCRDIEFDVPVSSLSFKVDSKKLADKAYKIGRSKSNIKNLKTIISGKKKGYTVNFDFSFDEERLLLMVTEAIQEKTTDSTPMTVETGTDRLYVTNAVKGKGADNKKIISDVKSILSDLKEKNKTINVEIIDTNADNLTADEFYNEYNREAKNAVYTKTADGHKIEPEVVGITLDKTEVKRILEENKNNTQTYEIPAKITYPSVTAKQLEDKYVNHIIASYTTSFAGSSANRCANIALAASKINGYVVNPGKRFSYNAVVGPRTAAAGFKIAHVYVGNQVADGIGGGICQVSSTLYNAVVLSDLKIVSRTNHSIPVGYTPLGRDATVSYGSIDFVFENNKSYPVSVKATISGQQITVSIVGTETPDYTVEFATEYVKAIPYSTEKVNDSSLADGQTKTVSAGSNGSIVNSYRVYKKNGKEINRKYEAKSTYSPVSAKVMVGTAKPADEPVPQPKPAEPAPAPEPTIPQVPENPDANSPSENTPTDTQTSSPADSTPQQKPNTDSAPKDSTDDPLDV